MILFCLSVSPSSLLINSGEEYFLEVESPSIYEISQVSVKVKSLSSLQKYLRF